MGDDDYDDFSKELNHYKKSKDRGRGEFSDLHSGIKACWRGIGSLSPSLSIVSHVTEDVLIFHRGEGWTWARQR